MKNRRISQYLKKYREGSTVMPTYVPGKNDILSRGINAQDYRDESMTDYALGKVPPVPQDVVTKKVDTVPAKEAKKTDNKYNLVPGGTKAVAQYQEMLKSKGLYDGNIDGAWGPKTQAAYESLMKKSPAKTSGSKANVNVDQKKKEVVIPKTFDPATKNQKNENLPKKVDVKNIQEDDPIAREKAAMSNASVFYNKVEEGSVHSRNNKYGATSFGIYPTKDTYVESFSFAADVSRDDSDEFILNLFYKGLNGPKDFGYRQGVSEELKRRGYELKEGKWIKSDKKTVVPKSFKRGGIVRMQTGGVAGDPPKGRRYRGTGSREEIFIEGEDGNLYFSGNNGKSYGVASPQVKDTFYGQLESQKQPNGRVMWSVDEPGAVSTNSGNVGTKNTPSRPNYIDTRTNDTPAQNPGLTLDPTSWGQDIFFSEANNVGAPVYPDAVSDVPDGNNPGLTTDPTSWGQEIIPKQQEGTSIDLSSPATFGLPGFIGSDNLEDSDSDSYSEVEKRIKELIDERKTDVKNNAAETLKDYEDLASRTGVRNAAGLATSILGRTLQNRNVKPFFRRPLFLDKKYQTYSAQQINQESEAATGAGVEAIKQMTRQSGSMAAMLAPIMMSRLTEQQGKIRKGYTDYNRSMESAKYGELSDIINFNEKARTDAENIKRDNTNKTIAGVSEDIGKFIQTINDSDGKMVDVKRQIKDKERSDLYKLDNQGIELDIIKLDYTQQKQYIQDKMDAIEAELVNSGENIDESQRKKLEENLAAYKRMQDKLNIKNHLK